MRSLPGSTSKSFRHHTAPHGGDSDATRPSSRLLAVSMLGGHLRASRLLAVSMLRGRLQAFRQASRPLPRRPRAGPLSLPASTRADASFRLQLRNQVANNSLLLAFPVLPDPSRHGLRTLPRLHRGVLMPRRRSPSFLGQWPQVPSTGSLGGSPSAAVYEFPRRPHSIRPRPRRPRVASFPSSSSVPGGILLAGFPAHCTTPMGRASRTEASPSPASSSPAFSLSTPARRPHPRQPLLAAHVLARTLSINSTAIRRYWPALPWFPTPDVTCSTDQLCCTHSDGT